MDFFFVFHLLIPFQPETPTGVPQREIIYSHILFARFHVSVLLYSVHLLLPHPFVFVFVFRLCP
jgi:hypothetical protein